MQIVRQDAASSWRKNSQECAGVCQVYAGPLEDGSRAVALFNRHTSGTQYPISNITVYWESLGRCHFPCLAWLHIAWPHVAEQHSGYQCVHLGPI